MQSTAGRAAAPPPTLDEEIDAAMAEPVSPRAVDYVEDDDVTETPADLLRPAATVFLAVIAACVAVAMWIKA